MLIGKLVQRFHDFRHEARIRSLGIEYLEAIHADKLVLARIIRKDLNDAIDKRSQSQWERIDARKLAAADPHARPFVQRQFRDRQA